MAGVNGVGGNRKTPRYGAGTDRSASEKDRTLALSLVVIAFILWLSWLPIHLWILPHLVDGPNVEHSLAAAAALISAFAFAGLIYTTLLQRKELELQRAELQATREELKRTAEANASIARDNKANAVFEMYKAFNSEHFEEVRSRSWRLFVHCARSRPYFDKFTSVFFCTQGNSDTLTPELMTGLRSLYGLAEDVPDANVHVLEHRDTHNAVSVMNFFNTLASRDAPKDAFRRCDFFYDWWRPFLWWIADTVEARYQSLSETERNYVIHPVWSEMLQKLDDIYDLQSGDTAEARLKAFGAHPLVRNIETDPTHAFRAIDLGVGGAIVNEV
jgi:hypothetical protein